MGVCKSNTKPKNRDDTKHQDQPRIEINAQNQSYSNLYQYIEDNNNAQDFQFNTSNFVMEKLGKITKEYTLLNPPLGKGAFGEVRKAIHKPTGILRAIKLLCKQNLTSDDQEKLINEVEILKKLDHPNIIKVLEFYQDDQFFYIVTELCSGGELFDKIIEEQFFSEKKAALIMKQILSAVFYCHQNQIVHRDLKPENLLFESNNEGSPLKVIDFGTSRVFDPSHKMDQKFGTVNISVLNYFKKPYYIAPEVLKKRYNEKCDIWSCGVILYIMLSGNPPFNGPNDKVIMNKVQQGKYSFDGPEWHQVSGDAKEFIKKMLEYDPEKRLTAEQALKDKWMTKFAAIKTVDQPLMKKTLENMHAFRVYLIFFLIIYQANHKLQEASWMFLVQYFTTKEEKNQLMKRFQAIDTNGDGVLQRDELIEAYKQFMSEGEATEQVDQIMHQIDKNNSGCIDYTEFVMATCNRQNMLSKDKLEVAFKMFDKDHSGALDVQELKNVFRGANVTDEMWNQIIQEVDENKDGQIQFQEFKKMMLKLLDADKL